MSEIEGSGESGTETYESTDVSESESSEINVSAQSTCSETEESASENDLVRAKIHPNKHLENLTVTSLTNHGETFSDYVFEREAEDPLFEKEKQDCESSKRTWGRLQLIKFIFLIVVYFSLTLVEVGGGAFVKCSSLVFHGVHRASDTLTFFVGVFIVLLSMKKKSARFPFGFERVEFVGALTVSVVMITSSVVMAAETTHAFSDHLEVIEYPWFVLGVSIVGFFVDSFGILLLSHDKSQWPVFNEETRSYYAFCSTNEDRLSSREDHAKRPKKKLPLWKRIFQVFAKMNQTILAFVIHLMVDSIAGVFATVVAVLNLTFPPKLGVAAATEDPDGGAHSHGGVCEGNCWVIYLDPLLTIVLSVLLLGSSIPVFVKNFRFLLLENPKEYRKPSGKLRTAIEKIQCVKRILDLKVWQSNNNVNVGSVQIALSLDELDDIDHVERIRRHVKLLSFELGVQSISVEVVLD